MSERTYSDHEINIPISGSFTTLKYIASGNHRVCHGNAGTIKIVPAGHSVTACWHEEIECIRNYLQPSLVAYAASSDNTHARVELIETYESEDYLIRQIGLALVLRSDIGEDRQSSLRRIVGTDVSTASCQSVQRGALLILFENYVEPTSNRNATKKQV